VAAAVWPGRTSEQTDLFNVLRNNKTCCEHFFREGNKFLPIFMP
jgi:hypothetical protein